MFELLLPLESALFPSVDETNSDNQNVSEHDDKSCGSDLPENESPGEEKHNFDVEQEKQECDEIELNRNRIDSVLKIRTAAFKRTIFYWVTLFRAEKLVHDDQHDPEYSEYQKDQ